MASHSVLFVCLGNICRSPMAEAIFRELLEERSCAGDWLVDSAGTGRWNLDELPDSRGQAVLKKHGLSSQHISRLVTREDFDKFEYILCMDSQNLRDVRQLAKEAGRAPRAKIELASDYCDGEVIHDPYYGRAKDFDTVFEQCSRVCKEFLDRVMH